MQQIFTESLSRFIGLSIVLLVLSATSAEIVIECEYTNETIVTLNNYDNTLCCFANLTSDMAAVNGTPIKIIPIDETQRFQVQHFRLVDQDISSHFDSIMKAIAVNFPKLRGIRLGNVSISLLPKDIFKSLPELELVSFDHNQIKELPSDLFTYTPKVKFLYFDYNLIASVNDNILNSLDIVEVDFSSNPCIKQLTCRSQLNHEKLKDKNPTLFHYYALALAMEAVLKNDPNYGR
ncbi:hypothetical protein Bhyg_15249 [Pseudolycoriella hygida]|uniref:Uncharacterized protein n=1 Tax=Pseudolycoriella hygida TaxID=35572 RepID=A0A9Q0RXW9_9DIPT|nr:hypothetical protein Bhyg_15249 [Pseudolycoriella hygida]